MVAEPEVLVASVESTSDRNVCPELALRMGWHGTGWDAESPPAWHKQHPCPIPALVWLHRPFQALDLIQREVEDAGQVVVGAPGRGEVTLSQKQRAHSSLPGTGVLPLPGAPRSFPKEPGVVPWRWLG